jgi:hypothetical protein
MMKTMLPPNGIWEFTRLTRANSPWRLTIEEIAARVKKLSRVILDRLCRRTAH